MTDSWLLGDTREYLLCDHTECGKTGARMRCGGCETQYYCEKTCQRSAWRQHKDLCKIFQKQKKDLHGKIVAILEEDMPGKVAEDESTCAICLQTPVARVKLSCNHPFCYDCLSNQCVSAIESGTMPAPVDMKLQNLNCPTCHAATLPLDILGCVLDEAAYYSERANLVLQHRKKFAPHAKELFEKNHARAAVVMDRVMEISKEDPFYPNLAFKRAELAAAAGEYTLGAAILAESTATFQEDGRHSYHMKTSEGQANYYNHFRLLGHCLLGAGRASEAKDVLQAGTQLVENEMGKHPKIDRDFYADFTWCMYELEEYEKAIGLGEEAVIDMNRTYAECHKYVALSKQALGDLDGAITTMRQALCYETPWDTANLDEIRVLLAQLLRASEEE